MRRLLLILLLTAGCRDSTPKAKALAGEIQIYNGSDNYLFDTILYSGESENSFGVVSKDCSATMGFCYMSLSEDLRIYWIEKPKGMSEKEHKNYPAYEASFDTKPLELLYDKVGSNKFIYHGNGKWTLQLFSMGGFEKDKLLKEIPAQKPVKAENYYKKFKKH